MYDDILDRQKSFKVRVRLVSEHVVYLDAKDAADCERQLKGRKFIREQHWDQPTTRASLELIGKVREVPMPGLTQQQYDCAVMRRLDRGQPLKPHDRERAVLAFNRYDPDLNPQGIVDVRLVDKSRPMATIPWHGWAVLAEGGGYRVHAGGMQSPTLHPSPEAAWGELHSVEHGDVVWPEEEDEDDIEWPEILVKEPNA